MKNSYRHLLLATALAAGLAAAPITLVPVTAEENATMQTDPGFNPGTGQINPGVEQQAPSQSTEIIKIPTPEESRAALLTPISKQPSTGDAQQANAVVVGQPPVSTTGAGSASAASAEPPPSGPIGSVGETLPAKFSKRNDILDRTPIMAWPQSLSDEERQQIYKAVMADKTQPAVDADALMPASELSTVQALEGMHPLPADVSNITNAKKLQYVKGTKKVLLVEPSTRIVVEQITS